MELTIEMVNNYLRDKRKLNKKVRKKVMMKDAGKAILTFTTYKIC